MGEPRASMAKEIAQAVIAFQRQTAGHAPKAATVVLSQDTLVITLHEALSPAERDLAKSPSGAAQVQEFHRQLFANSSKSLRDDIARITGVDVLEAVAEIGSPVAGAVLAFTSSAMVQVFRLAKSLPGDSWSGPVPSESQSEGKG